VTTKPPVHLNALRALEASARHQSFAAAAQELNVSAAAVGQLVRTLEDWLGTALFERSRKGAVRLVPTEVAQKALPDIRAGLDRLTLGLERLKDGSAKGVLTVTTSPAFAAKWLLPRLERFQQRWPDTDVRLDTSLKPLDFLAQRIDIGIRYGLGRWPGLVAEALLSEELFPACSAEFLARQGGFSSPEALLGQTLIHDASLDAEPAFPTWAQWFQQAGVTGPRSARGLQINSAAAVLQACIDGQGVALARSVMAQEDLATGRLVRLFPQINMASPMAYYIVYRPECAALPKLSAFRAWLLQEAE
jgi:LysR family transcriptional regulator, glycine cleavage system transcriptional activator